MDAGCPKFGTFHQSIMSSWFRFLKGRKFSPAASDLVIKPPGHDGWCDLCAPDDEQQTARPKM